MPLNEIIQLVVAALGATLLSVPLARRLFGARVKARPASETWTCCAAGSCLGSFAGLIWVGTFPLLDHFPIDYVVNTVFAVPFALAVTKSSLPRKSRDGDDGAKP